MRSKLFLYISLAADIVIATSKFVASGFTGSSSMLSEGVHSVIDASSQVLLLWGIRRSRREADYNRPFGYGRELYFWSFIVSLIMFLLGGCISLYKGLMKFRNPVYSNEVQWNYIILGIAFLFTCISMTSALQAFNKQRGDAHFFRAITQSKDPSTFIVLLGDLGDLVSLVVAFFGIYLEHKFHDPHFDAIASLLIGLILIAVSMLLVRESKSLLMGESLSKKSLARVVGVVEADDAVLKVKKHFSTYLAPDEIILQLNAVFKDDLNTAQITSAIQRIIHTIQKEFPRIKQIFIEPVAK